MTLWFRLIWVLAGSLFRRRLGVFDQSRLSLAVLPNDLDVNFHMNNARYLAVMDLGRVDLLVRTGMGWRLMRAGLQPVLGGAMVRYRRAMGPFQRFHLCSCLVGWDDRWFYIEHSLESRGQVTCTALVKGAFLRQGQRVSPETVAARIGWRETSPPLPAWVESWRAFDGRLDDEAVASSMEKAETCAG